MAIFDDVDDVGGMGLALIACERVTHQGRGWDLEHDRGHEGGELAKIAALLAVDGAIHADAELNDDWGLLDKTDGNRLRRLVIAGSLLAAEIDRLLAEASQGDLYDLLLSALDERGVSFLHDQIPGKP